MSDNTLATNDLVTDTAGVQNSENQATETKSYTQKEVDDMMARMKSSLHKKLLKPYEDLGDPDELRALREEAAKKQQQEQLKRGEFEKTLQEIVSKKDLEIQKRDSVIKEYKVNTPLLSAAAQYRAVNAEQVKALLSNNVRLNADGEVEVVDSKGAVRYSDNGEPLGVDALVKEFLDTNPHFVMTTPSTTNTKSAHTNLVSPGLDISKLDMKNPEHRKAYAEFQQKAKVKI